MKRKQKIVSRLPSLKERHMPGGYNWVGPGTSIYDRITLKYQGKVGTKSFWLPRNKLDLAAFKHDLSYYMNDDSSRIQADRDFINDVSVSTISSIIASALIETQLRSRFGSELGKIAVTAVGFRELLKGLNILLRTPLRPRGQTVASYLLRPHTGVAPQVVKDFFQRFGIKGSMPGKRKKNFVRYYISKILLFGSALYGTNSWPSDLKKFATKMKEIVFTGKDNKPLDKVFETYKNYLKTVGEFDSSGEFIITKKGDKRAYLKFFKQFTKYIDFVNKENESGPKYPKPTLNAENRDIVSFDANPKIITPLETVEEIKKPAVNLLDFAEKTIKEPTVNLSDFAEKHKAPVLSAKPPVSKGVNLLDFAEKHKAPVLSATHPVSRGVNFLDFAI